MEINKCYRFWYRGLKNTRAHERTILVTEVNESSVLGRMLDLRQLNAIRRFNFDRMTSEPKEIK